MFSLSPCNKPAKDEDGFRVVIVCKNCGASWSHFNFSWKDGEACPKCIAPCVCRYQVIARKVRLWGYASKWNLWGRIFGQKMWETIEGHHVHELKELFERGQLLKRSTTFFGGKV